jgi:DNA-binding NtrC family response regulator
VRELQNTVERAVALARFERLGVSDLPPKLQRARTTASAFQIEDPDFMPALADLEKRYILHVLDRCDGNRTRASEVLGIDRKTLYRKLERWSEEEEEEG